MVYSSSLTKFIYSKNFFNSGKLIFAYRELSFLKIHSLGLQSKTLKFVAHIRRHHVFVRGYKYLAIKKLMS